MLKLARKASLHFFLLGLVSRFFGYFGDVYRKIAEQPIPHVTRRLTNSRRWTSRRSRWLMENIMLLTVKCCLCLTLKRKGEPLINVPVTSI